MSMHGRVALAVVFGLALAGCSGSSNPPTCSFADPAQLASSKWPKFRADRLNTGTVNNLSVSLNARMQWMFPEAGEPPKGSFIASPVINNDKNDDSSLIYIGSNDGTLYALHMAPAAATPPPTPVSRLSTTFNLTIIPDAITSTALVAVRDGQDAIFVGGGDGDVHGVIPTGAPQVNYWPFPLGGSVHASPNLHVGDGTVYAGSLNGLFAGVCPNGIARFGVSTLSTQSSAAIG